MNKSLLTGAFEKMGPERVERMLLAFGPWGGMNYCRCALGFAAGYEEATEEQLNDECHRADMSFIEFLAQRIGITVIEADVIEAYHFWRHQATGKHFVVLANEWLENRPASIRVAPRETGVGVGE